MGRKKTKTESKYKKKERYKELIRKMVEVKNRNRKLKSNQNPDAEVQNAEPVASIYFYQENREALNKVEVPVVVKEEPTIEYEIGPSKPDLDLQVECDPNSIPQLQNVVIGDNLTESGEEPKQLKRSTRIKIKEVKNQAKILADIQANKKKQSEEIKPSDIVEENEEGEGQSFALFVHQQNDELVIEITEEKPDVQHNFVLEKEQEANIPKEIPVNSEPALPFETVDCGRPIEDHRGFQKENEQHKNDNVIDEFLVLNKRETIKTPAKSKRGRPRKPSVPSADCSVATEKPKWGRPRKVVDEPKVKRKRGPRPKPRDECGDKVDIPIAVEDDGSEDEYTVFISEELAEDPIHLDVQGVINFLV